MENVTTADFSNVSTETEQQESGTNARINEVEFQFGPWTIVAHKSHILQSNCTNPEQCNNAKQPLCTVCRFSKELPFLPHLPDMVFGDNCLRIEHKAGGFGIEFNTLDALKLVNSQDDLMKVAVADAWREARASSEHINEVVKPFDWTFTTKYNGTVIGNDQHERLKVLPTNEKIDVDRLKQKEKILFYEDVHLFEDELADNGCALISVKIRVMPTSFFILQRFYLRVDNVLVRILDTRLYHDVSTNYLLREFSTRESNVAELQSVPLSVLTDPNEVWAHLRPKDEYIDKLEFTLDIPMS